MIWLVATGAVLFVLFMAYCTLFLGVRSSLSQVGVDRRWLFMGFIWAEAFLLLPALFTIVPSCWHWLVFLVGAGLLLLGGAGIVDKDDSVVHCAGALLACGGSLALLALMKPCLLFIPLVCLASWSQEHWKWNTEVGIVMAMYLLLMDKLYSFL